MVNETEAAFPKNVVNGVSANYRYKKSSIEIVPDSDQACFSPHYETGCQVCKKTTVRHWNQY